MVFAANPAAAGAGLTLHRARVAIYESLSNQAAQLPPEPRPYPPTGAGPRCRVRGHALRRHTRGERVFNGLYRRNKQHKTCWETTLTRRSHGRRFSRMSARLLRC